MIGLSDAHWFHHIEVAALKIGKSLENIDIAAVKASMMEMKKAADPRIYPNHLQIAQALKNEEIADRDQLQGAAAAVRHRGRQRQPIVSEEGGIAIIFGFVMPKKRRIRRAPSSTVNALLDPDGLVALVQKSFYSPANTKAVPAGRRAEKDRVRARGEQKMLHNRPHAFWLKNRSGPSRLVE